MKKEYISCDFCRNNNTRLFYRKQGFSIVKCRYCDLVYINPRLATKYTNRQYSRDYFSKHPAKLGGYENYLKDQRTKITNSNYILHRLKQITPRKGKLLDIGCAYGIFLSVAKKQGFQTFGIEPNKEASSYAKTELKLDIINDFFNQKYFQKKYFDIITLLDVLEHMSNPVGFLKNINNLLAKNGILIILTPNVDGLFRKLMGNSWPHFKPEEHLYYFSPQTIERLLNKSSFKILKIENYRKRLSLKYLRYELNKDINIRIITKIIDKIPLLQKLQFPFSLDEMLIFAKN